MLSKWVGGAPAYRLLPTLQEADLRGVSQAEEERRVSRKSQWRGSQEIPGESSYRQNN